MNLQRKIGPLSLWVYLVAIAGLVALWWWHKRSSTSGSGEGSTATVLTTGVLPTPMNAAPASNAAPAASLSPDVQSQLSDLTGALAGVVAQQSQLSTDFDSQAQSIQSEQQQIASGFNDINANLTGFLSTLYQPPTVTTPTATPTPIDLTVHVKQTKATPKPTTKTTKAKAKKAVTKTKTKVPKKKAAR